MRGRNGEGGERNGGERVRRGMEGRGWGGGERKGRKRVRERERGERE